MTELHVCRLCGSEPVLGRAFQLTASCSNSACGLSNFPISKEEWQKLMYVPAKLTSRLGALPYDFVEGYNAAIDDMEKGGA